MYYRKKENRISFLTEKTYAEKITGLMDMKTPPTKKQIKRFYIMMAIGSLFLLLNTSSVAAHEAEIETINYWDGAGDQWTCSNCGTTNYKWQNSCSNCGNSQ